MTGYLYFGEHTVDDVLKNFSSSYNLAIIARLAMACVVIFTFPLANNALRASLVNIIWGGDHTPDTLPTGTAPHMDATHTHIGQSAGCVHRYCIHMS